MTFKKYPLVKQSGLKDCGVSCMLMLIRYYKGNAGVEYLRDLTKTNKKGTTAHHIIEGMKSLGFESYGIRCSIDDLMSENIVLPTIAHITVDEKYKHFVVIYEINKTKKIITYADPECGFKKVKSDEFEKTWSGVIIINYPVRKIINENPPINFFNFIIDIIIKHKKEFVSIVILSLFVMVTSVLTSFYLQYMIDGQNISMDKNYLIFICLFFVILYFIRIFSDYFRNQVLIHVNQKVDIILTMDVFKKIISLPYQYYSNRTTGEVVSRINDLGFIRTMFSRLLVSSIIDLPLAVLSSIVMFFISYKLFIFTLIVFALYFLIILFFRNKFNDYVKTIQEKRAFVNSYMIESISGVNSVKGINMEQKVINNFEKKYVNLLKSVFSFENLLNIQYLLKEIISNGSYIVVILFGCFLVIDGELTLGSLLSFSALINFFLNPIRNLVDLDKDIRDSKSAFKRVLDLVFYNKKEGIVEKLVNGDIVVDNLSYSYDDVEFILNNIDLKILKGEKVMIMGPTGCGKSTLLKLIMKFQNVKRGMIKIGGIDINDYKDNAVRKRISYISQKETLFTDTLFNNLSLYSKDNLEVLSVSKMCYVDQIIKSENLGYNVLVEEDGFNFSGGEKQRIVLARTLLKPFDILLVDEGLNQIDVKLERKILKNIFDYFHDKTIIIVSHRDANKDLFDKTFYFQKNKIVEM